jgi:hypothetical protein
MRNSVSKISLVCLLTAICISVGCTIHIDSLHSPTGSQGSSNRVSLKLFLDKADSDALPANLSRTERQWVSLNNWYPKPTSAYVDVMLEQGDSAGTIIRENVRVDDYQTSLWPGSNQPGEPVELVFNSDAGRLTFEGELGRGDYQRDVTAYGTVAIEISRDQVTKIETAFGQRPSLTVLISLIMKDVSVERLLKFANCGMKFTLDQAGDLVAYNFEADSIQKLIDAGYKFNADDIVTIARHNISVDYAIQWKKAGYDLAVKDLIYAKQRDISPETAQHWNNAQKTLTLEQLFWVKQRDLHSTDYLAWKQAGTELSLEQLFWVKQRDLNAGEYKAWKETGYDISLEKLFWLKQRDIKPQTAMEWKNSGASISLEDIFWAKQRDIKPEKYLTWKKVGYDLSLEKLFWIQQRDLKSQEAAEWKQLGYNFSIEDLYELKRYDVRPTYGAAFAHPDYEPFSAGQLIEFKRTNISPQTIQNIRKRK